MKYLSVDEAEPSDAEWAALPLYTFSLPSNHTDPIVERLDDDSPNLVLLYVTVAVVIVVAIVVIALRFARRHRDLKHLEGLLAEVEGEVGDNGELEHYVVMRTHGEDSDVPPTVVADRWELPHSCIKVGRVLGSGAFGQVIKGRVSRSLMMHRGIDVVGAGVIGTGSRRGTHITVAVKVLQEITEERYTADFLKEIQMMKDIGYHTNVVSILGCCTLREPYCLVVEHLPHGDLLAYLRKIHHKIQQKEVEIGPYVNQEAEFFSPHDLLSFARQITVGMVYLSQKGYVHRDLAARNILVSANNTVKIGDFGLARYIYANVGKVYVNRRGGKLPLKWMSVEAIFDLTFSTASDVWAFGVLLFEIVTLGGCPYPTLSNTDLVRQLGQGYRMEKPANCSPEIYEIMLQCWRARPDDRPGFGDLHATFTQLLQDETGVHYIDLNIGIRQYYDINTDDMDPSLPTVIDIADSIDDAVLAARTTDMGLGQKYVVAEILNENLISDKTTKTDHVKGRTGDIINVEESNVAEMYSGREFFRSSSVTSIHNQLYDTVEKSASESDQSVEKDMPDSDRTEARDDSKLETSVPVSNTLGLDDAGDTPVYKSQLQDRISNCSDEVFSSCPGCIMVGTGESSVDTDHTIYHCLQCGRIDLKLTQFDIHMSDRNDSAISSATSDDLNQGSGSSSDISSMCSDYLMPDSAHGSLTETESVLNESSDYGTVGIKNCTQNIPSDTTREYGNTMDSDDVEIIAITHL